MVSHAYATYAYGGVLEALAMFPEFPDRAELKRKYLELEDEDIRQAQAFAAALVDDKVFPLPQR